MKILFLNDAPVFGGHEVMAVAAAEALSAKGHQVTFEYFEGNKRLEEALGVARTRSPALAIRAGWLRSYRLNTFRALVKWNSIAKLAAHLRAEAPDVLVTVQGRIEGGAVALWAARRAGVRQVTYLPMAHRLVDVGARPLPRLRDLLNRVYYRLPGSYITISPAMRKQIEVFAPDARIEIVENLVERSSAVVSKADARAALQLNLPAGATLLGMFGRIDFAQKGHDRLLEALKAESLADMHLLVVGDGPHREALLALAEQPALKGRVHHCAWTPAMDTAYAAVDAVVLPSRYEGVPLVMTEALIRRIPVAASRRDGMADWLPERVLFDADDTGANMSADMQGTLRFVVSEDAPAALLDAFDHAVSIEGQWRYGTAWEAALKKAIARS